MAASGWGQLPRGPDGSLDLTPLYNAMIPATARIYMTAAVWDPSSGTVYVAAEKQGDVGIIAIDRDGDPRSLAGTTGKDWMALVVYGPGQLFGLASNELLTIEDTGIESRVRNFAGGPIQDHASAGTRRNTAFADARTMAISHRRPNAKLAVTLASFRPKEMLIMETQLDGQDPLNGEANSRFVPVGDFEADDDRAKRSFANADYYAACTYSSDDRHLFVVRGPLLYAVEMATGMPRTVWRTPRNVYEHFGFVPEGLLVDRDGALVSLGQQQHAFRPRGLREVLISDPPIPKRAQKIGFGPEGTALVAMLGTLYERQILFRPRILATDEDVAAALVANQGTNTMRIVATLVTAMAFVPGIRVVSQDQRNLVVAAVRRARFAGDATNWMLASTRDYLVNYKTRPV